MESFPDAARNLIANFGEAIDRGLRELAPPHWVGIYAWDVAGVAAPSASQPRRPLNCTASCSSRDVVGEFVVRDDSEHSAVPSGEFSVGEVVHVWSNSKNRWMEDGVVERVMDGGEVASDSRWTSQRAGSVMVVFNGGSSAKWVLPGHFRSVLQKAPRPRAAAAVPPQRPAGQPAVALRHTSSVDPESARFSVCSDQGDTLAELATTEEACREPKRQFSDPDFGVTLAGRVRSWSRPQDIGRHDGRELKPWEPLRIFWASQPVVVDWQLFRGTPCADDVQQGELGDCWFLSSLAALAEFQGGCWVRNLLPGQDTVNPYGAYLVRLCLGGRWRNIMVDDRLPCLGGGAYFVQLAYCVTNRLQLWASLIEKAFAKACGSYQAIVGGEAGEALSVLTGWPCTLIRFDREDFVEDVLWATLCSSRDAQFLMTCSTAHVRSIDAASLVPFHVYSLITVHEVVRARSGCIRLLKIRNPHTKLKWQGAWSDASPEWTPKLRAELGCPEGGSPGVFFMALDDFLQRFAHCTICRIRSHEWFEVRKDLCLPAEDVPCVGLLLEASETTECSISLAQPEPRIRQGPLCKGLPEHLGCLGFVLLCADAKEASAATATAHLRSRPAVSVDCWLQPHLPYLFVPMSLLAADAPLSASFACVSSRHVGIKERPLTRAEIRAAWAVWTRQNDPAGGEQFHGATFYVGKADGGAIVVLAENRGQGNFGVELRISSEKMRFSRGVACTTDWLRPGCGQILQVALPDNTSGGSAGWRSAHTFHMTGKSPEPMWHVPSNAAGEGSLHAPFELLD